VNRALPAAAAAFWAGLLAWQLHPSWFVPWMGFALGASALVGAGLAAPRRAPGPGPLALAGLAPARPPAVDALAPRARPQVRGRTAALALALAGVFALGVGWAGMAAGRIDGSLLTRLVPRRIEAIGTLRQDPVPGQSGWHAVVDVSRVAWDGGSATLRESAWIQGRGRLPGAVRGDRVSFEGVLRLAADPGFFLTLRHQGIAVEVVTGAIARLGPSPNLFVRSAQIFRAFVGRSIDRLFAHRESGLLMGLALGDASRLDPKVAGDFQATGLGHLLVVSGENVAMVLAPMLALAVLLRLTRWPRFGLGVTTVVFFVVLTGAEPSVMRAGVMATLTLIGVLLGRPRSTGAVLSAAVLGLLILDPRLVWSIGFQLSVAATVGMAVLAQPLSERIGRHVPKSFALASGTTLSAQLGVTPLLLFHFHQVPGVTIATNLLAFPAVAPALLLGLGAGAIGIASPTLARPVAALASVPLHYLEWVADKLAKAPVGHVASGGGPFVLIVGFLFVAGLAWWLRTGWRPPRSAVVVAVACLPLIVWTTALRTGPPSGLTVRFIDVGQGDAALVTTPDGAEILIDGGPDKQQVATRLQALGVRRLDLVVATHPHADHIVGLPAVLADFHVGLILEPGCPDTSAMQADLDTAIADDRIPVRYPRVGDTFTVGAVRLDVLSPDRCWIDTNSDPNNDSLVILLSYREDTVLFGGEPEQPAQQQMLDEREPVHAEVMKVPHHGAATSLPQFFQAVDAKVAVISVGPNMYGHPVPSTIQAIQDTGSQVWRTDQHGDVVVTFDAQGPVVASQR
jgi:competence protein ComEC